MIGFFCKPKILVFFVSFNCNLRCAMCSAWIKQKQVKEPDLNQIRTLFADKILKESLEIINITGGEPTLRGDLSEIIKLILQNCSKIKRIDISTNGVNTLQVVDQIERILALLLPTNIKLTTSISLDGLEEVHEQVRQTQKIFANIENTIYALKELMALYPFFNLGINMTISRFNYKIAEEVKRYVQDKGLGINFTLSALSDIGVESMPVKDNFEMQAEEKEEFIISLKKMQKAGEFNQDYLNFMAHWLLTGKRNGNCAFRKGKSILLEPSGDLYLCGNFKEFKIGNIFSEPFSRMRSRIPGISKYYARRCLTCSSNCYITEANTKS